MSEWRTNDEGKHYPLTPLQGSQYREPPMQVSTISRISSSSVLKALGNLFANTDGTPIPLSAITVKVSGIRPSIQNLSIYKGYESLVKIRLDELIREGFVEFIPKFSRIGLTDTTDVDGYIWTETGREYWKRL